MQYDEGQKKDLAPRPKNRSFLASARSSVRDLERSPGGKFDERPPKGLLFAASMDRIEYSGVQLPVDNSEVLDERLGTSVDGSLPSCRSVKGNENIGNDSTFYEKIIPDDLDSYWDEINDRLNVSRMVSDSVIKGIVNAVAEEAADKIASKEAEIAILNERLRSGKSDEALLSNRLAPVMMFPKPTMIDVKIEKTLSELHQSYLDASVDLNYAKHLSRMKLAAEEQLHRLQEDLQDLGTVNSHGRINVASTDPGTFGIFPKVKADEKLLKIDEPIEGLKVMLALGFEQINDMFCLVKTSMGEQKWEHEFQEEISNFMIQNYQGSARRV